MADCGTGANAEDGGMGIGRTLGAQRLKALLLISQHPELDDAGWSGQVLIHFGQGSVKGAVHPTPAELNL